jgi:hypothetical protein
MATTRKYKYPYLTQKQVFLDTIYDAVRDDGEVTKEQVIFYLEKLYSSAIKGDRYFYAQDEQGLPEHRVETRIANIEFYCKLLDCNQFNPDTWRSTPRPANFIGIWPPREPADLLGLQKGKCSRRKVATWNDPGNQFFYESINIRKDPITGYGLYARKKILGGQWIGQYAGILVPRDDTLPEELTVYQFGIDIGKPLGKKLQGKKATQPTCWVDATKAGSCFRFMAHSCEPNAEITEESDHEGNRILAVGTLCDITEGEPITINYGTDWFTGNDKCRCGSRTCKNPFNDGDNILDEDTEKNSDSTYEDSDSMDED